MTDHDARISALSAALCAAAKLAGVHVMLVDRAVLGFYRVERTGSALITIGVSESGYTVRCGTFRKSRYRWRKLGTWKRPSRVIYEVGVWTS